MRLRKGLDMMTKDHRVAIAEELDSLADYLKADIHVPEDDWDRGWRGGVMFAVGNLRRRAEELRGEADA